MNYKNWLEKTISDMLVAKNDKLKLKVYEQSNARYDGGIYDCTIVINDLGGTSDTDDIVVVPIQLMCLSGGQIEVDEEGNTAYDVFYDVLKEFCKTYNLQSLNIDYDYYKMTYILPMPINPLEEDSGSFRLNFVVSGTLTIAKNISDINSIKINNVVIPFLSARLTYATSLSPSKKITQKLTRNRITNSSLTLSIDCYNRNNVLGNIFKALRTEDEVIKANEKLKCEIVFNDGSSEQYYFVISSVALTNDRTNPTTTSYEFALY